MRSESHQWRRLVHLALMQTVLLALVGIAGTVLGALVNGWLKTRGDVTADTRQARLRAYPVLWKRTSVVSRWPRTQVHYEHLQRLHDDLRTWYYDVGGIHLSSNARQRYGNLQQYLEGLIGAGVATGELAGQQHDDLIEAASAVRTALAEDLESRQQRSIGSALALWRRHHRQRRDAAARLSRLPATGIAGRRIVIPPDEEQLTDVAGSPSNRSAVNVE